MGAQLIDSAATNPVDGRFLNEAVSQGAACAINGPWLGFKKTTLAVELKATVRAGERR